MATFLSTQWELSCRRQDLLRGEWSEHTENGRDDLTQKKKARWESVRTAWTMRVTLFLVPGPWESLMPFNKRVFSVSFQYTHVVLRLIWSFYYLQSKCIYKQNGHFNSISDNKEYGMDEGDIFAERLSRSSWVNINIKREAESSSELFVLCLWSISSVLKQFFLHNFSSFTLIFLWRRFSDLFILPYLKFHHKWLFKFFFISLPLFD